MLTVKDTHSAIKNKYYRSYFSSMEHEYCDTERRHLSVVLSPLDRIILFPN